MKKKINALSELTDYAFKPLMSLLFMISIYYISQFTATMKAVEAHLIVTDNRILAIEVSREAGMKNYDKLLVSFEEIKTQVIKNTANIEELKSRRK